jgi:predicted metalloprotease with PDZ domain
MHVTYNVSALKVYVLDRLIRNASGGERDLMAFVRDLWTTVKDRTEPQQLSEDEVIASLVRVAGQGKGGYLRELAGTCWRL